MDAIIVLLILCGALLVYQIFFKRDEDSLDDDGNPVKKRK